MRTIIDKMPRVYIIYYTEMDIRGKRIKGKSARTGNWETIDKFWLGCVLESIEERLFGKNYISNFDGVNYASMREQLQYYLNNTSHNCKVIY